MIQHRYVLEDTTCSGAIILTDKVIETFARYRQRKFFQTEAGGQLFAEFSGADTFIVEATPPRETDKRRRYSFQPDRELQLSDIENRHVHGRHYVGDWHTHPQRVPNPSPVDIGSMVECFHKSSHVLKAFILIVVGTSIPPKGLYVGLVQNGSFRRMVVEHQLT